MNKHETDYWCDNFKSSLIAGFGTKEEDLIVEFYNGTTYIYPGLADYCHELESAESVGKHFSEFIRHQPCSKLSAHGHIW